MATDENQDTSNPQIISPDPTTTSPEYPEMILSAIKALNEKEGSNKTSITKQIETVHRDLHPAHATLVSHHLDLMKSSNQLLFINNNYLIPDSTSPPPQRRGRGRPPKAKTPGEVSSGTKVKASVSGRKRGRPAKVVSGDGEKKSVSSPATGGEVKRGRGRPPKAKESDVVAAAAAAPVGA